MSNFDKTGPQGMGPTTGKGFGMCGLGWRRGFGAGRGLGRYFGWDKPQTKEEKLKDFSDYKKALEEELEDVKKEEKELSASE
ncbi:DUF5320 domain-containing protein [Patescibacteria group bacterium]|nr:DUF5320 domain-containing protein [Patescibacteria group bacterium]